MIDSLDGWVMDPGYGAMEARVECQCGIARTWAWCKYEPIRFTRVYVFKLVLFH
jgi:hypothetical protein